MYRANNDKFKRKRQMFRYCGNFVISLLSHWQNKALLKSEKKLGRDVEN